MSLGFLLFLQCRVNISHLLRTIFLILGFQSPSPFPTPLLLHRAISTSHSPKGGQSQASLRRMVKHLSICKWNSCFIYGYLRAFSHICFCLNYYCKLSFLSFGETYIIHFPFYSSILIVPLLTFSQIEKSKMANLIRSILPAEMVLGRDFFERAGIY